MAEYTDTSYPPIGTSLRYQRGDGAIVTLKIEEPGIAATLPPPQLQPLQLNPQVHFEGRPRPAQVVPQQPAKQPILQPVEAGPDEAIFDNDYVGGRFTVCVLLYGPSTYHTMHRRCLESIITTVPAGRMDLRIGSNELCSESVDYVECLVQKGLCSKHYRHPGNDRKYPVMREMFYDPSHPINTKWLIWFDDDSIADRDPQWLTTLAQLITAYYPQNSHMFGAKHIWTFMPGQLEWYKSRPWYRGKLFRDHRGAPVPNGNKILFAAGGFWALSTQAMRACNIPDPELGHNGGDYTIGEQLWQGGFSLKAFNGQKQFVHTSSVPRRGVTDPFPGVR